MKSIGIYRNDKATGKMNFYIKKLWGMAGLFYCGTALAVAPADYADRFKIDMDEPIPPLAELRKQYAPKPVYDRHFDYYWDIGTVFDRPFAETISSYGTRDRRLKWQGEDELVEMIETLPKNMYPYIGPYLHTLPGIPEKILNMPGIRETKNKFPEKIAKRLQHIENLEFLSPAFYYLLMPEIWGEESDNKERPKTPPMPIAAPRYDNEYMKAVNILAPAADFAPGAQPQEPLESQLRTISPDASSPLTSKDIRAVVRSFDDIADFGADLYNRAKIYEAGNLLDMWENDNGKGTIIPNLKDLVHPCRRLVQKLKMQGMEKEFAILVAKEGFTPEEWGYTCDKVVKAYRVLNMSQPEALTVMLYRRNIYETPLTAFSDKVRPGIAATMQSMVEMYQAPIKDVLEAKKNKQTIKAGFERIGYRLVGQPIFIK